MAPRKYPFEAMDRLPFLKVDNYNSRDYETLSTYIAHEMEPFLEDMMSMSSSDWVFLTHASVSERSILFNGLTKIIATHPEAIQIVHKMGRSVRKCYNSLSIGNISMMVNLMEGGLLNEWENLFGRFTKNTRLGVFQRKLITHNESIEEVVVSMNMNVEEFCLALCLTLMASTHNVSYSMNSTTRVLQLLISENNKAISDEYYDATISVLRGWSSECVIKYWRVSGSCLLPDFKTLQCMVACSTIGVTLDDALLNYWVSHTDQESIDRAIMQAYEKKTK